MQPYKAREVRKALQTKGFKEENRDHYYYFLYYKGRKSNIYTKISLHQSEISKALCAAMARQIKLTSSQFHQFVDCALTGEAYVKLLLELRHISEPKDAT